MTLLLVLLGGAVGAPLRYLADAWVSRRVVADVPWGTLAVNVAGSFVLGVLAAAAPAWLLTLGGVGLCGALTTFSTFSFESVRLLEQGRTGWAVLNVLASVGGALVAVAAGHALGTTA
jgi:CrcB protein